jgi:hypothetical protein
MRSLEYVSKSGEVKDAYATNSWLHWVIHIGSIVLGCGIIASIVLVINYDIPYSVTEGSSYGALLDKRYNSAYWGFGFLFCFHMLVWYVIQRAILYRRTACCGGKRQSSVGFFIAILTPLIFVVFVGAVIGLALRGSCNNVDDPFNPCNDKRWCLVKEIYEKTPNNLCPRPNPDPGLKRSDLSPDADFLWMLALSIVFTSLEGMFWLLLVGLWIKQDFSLLDDGSDVSPPPPPAPTITNTKTPLLQEIYQKKDN